MHRYALSDTDWHRLAPLLPGKASDPGRTARSNRLFLDAVNYMARNGGPWRDLPRRYGKWNSVWRRFDRWSRKGVWQRLFEHFQDPDLEWLLLDATSVRAHQHAAGAKKGGLSAAAAAAREALGRSRGGLTTKLHAACDALGNSLRLFLTPGQRGDAPQAAALIGSLRPGALIADTAYDTDQLRAWARSVGTTAVIPSNPRRALKPPCDEELYAERNRIERLFGRLKLNRRLATRYEKTARNYLSFALWASTVVLLR